jgi:hypothetical protein
MKKIMLLISAMTLFIGCAAKNDYQSILLEQGNTDYKVNITMQQEVKTLDPTLYKTVVVYINGNRALKGPMEQTGEVSLEGLYNNKKLDITCVKEGLFTVNPKCVVHLDNIRLGKYEIDILHPVH